MQSDVDDGTRPRQIFAMKYGLVVLITALLAGCAGTMLPGKLYALSDATQLKFAIETSRGHGKMTAQNPKTGETFAGEYTAILHGGGTTVTQASTFNPTQRVSPTNMPGQGFTATSYSPPTEATARGILIGDQGTSIQLYLNIQPGIRLRGTGKGIDNKGERYQVQF